MLTNDVLWLLLGQLYKKKQGIEQYKQGILDNKNNRIT